MVKEPAADHRVEVTVGEGQGVDLSQDSRAAALGEHGGRTIQSEVAPAWLERAAQAPRPGGRVEDPAAGGAVPVQQSEHQPRIAPAGPARPEAWAGVAPPGLLSGPLRLPPSHSLQYDHFQFHPARRRSRILVLRGFAVLGQGVVYPADVLRDSYPYYLAGAAVEANQDLLVLDKFTGEVACRVARADRETVLTAISAAAAAEPAMRGLASFERQGILAHCARRFEERAEELAGALCVEAGKPIRDARGEVGRLIETFRMGAEEATRVGGEVLPLDVTPRARGYRGMTRRVPVGACGLITPWNFPLNLVAHKVAPAIAAGCPFVLKPASATPVGALVIGEVLAECDLPEGAFSILPCAVADA